MNGSDSQLEQHIGASFGTRSYESPFATTNGSSLAARVDFGCPASASSSLPVVPPWHAFSTTSVEPLMLYEALVDVMDPQPREAVAPYAYNLICRVFSLFER